MVKLLGALGVFCALSWCGARCALWYRRRTACLAAWQSALREGERMLCELGMQTAEWLNWMRTQPGFAAFAQRCLAKLGGESAFSQLWRESILAAEFPLEENELALLCSVGEVIGRYDAAGQRAALHTARSRLSECEKRAEAEVHSKGKMWSVLGVSAGVLAVVLLY